MSDLRLLELSEARWALAAAALFAAGGVAELAGAPTALWWAFYLGCYACGGWEPARAGLQALRSRMLDVDLLMVLAALVAAAIGQVLDGALLIVIFATSGALEALATKRTADSVRALLDLAPEQATLLRPDGTTERIETARLAVTDVILVRPGERVGADGVVVDGASDVDQASITGEALPVLKRVGDEVFAGTMNATGALRVRVSRPAEESVIARIAALVEQAAATKARLQLFIERVEQRYSVMMVAATVALFVIPLALGGALQPTLLRAMTFMIVASPCAVVLATMPPLLAAIANAGRHGILVKSALVMELLGHTDAVAFDKTGTLTEGRPRVLSVRPAGGYGADEVLALAAATEQRSEHPLARAIVAAALDRGLRPAEVTDFTSAPGQGVAARVGARLVRVGAPEVSDDVADLVAGGATAVAVRVDGHPAGVIALADEIRPDASAAIGLLARITGRTPALLTGDNSVAAARIATQVGISHVHAGLLPAEKVDRVLALQHEGRRVLLVGDGVNDAPAMATADVGLAMGRHGSDLALQTADAVIVRDELATVPAVIALSRRARARITANLIIAGLVIGSLVVWDLAGSLPLPLGVAGHEGSTVIVGLNGLWLLRSSAWHRPRD